MKISTWLREDISIRKGSMRISITGQVEKYHKEYEQTLATHRKFEYHVYKVDDRRLVHVKIPSSVKGMAYDVVIEFITLDTGDLERSDIHVFSNAPSFVYNSAFALMAYGDYINTGRLPQRGSIRRGNDCQIIQGLETKLSDRALMKPPDVRNPTQIALPDKTVYFGMFYILENIPVDELLNKGISTSIGRIAGEVLSFDETMQLRRRLEKAHKDEKKNREKRIDEEFEQSERKQVREQSKRAQQLSRPSKPKALTPARGPSKPKGAVSMRTTRRQ